MSNITLCLKEFPRAKPEGTPEGKGLYLTLYHYHYIYMDGLVRMHSCTCQKDYKQSLNTSGGEREGPDTREVVETLPLAV